MITDDEVMRLFERADPARFNDAMPVVDAADYLAALRTRSNNMTMIETAPTPTEPTNRNRWPMIAAAAAVVLVVAGALVFATRDDDAEPVVTAVPQTTVSPDVAPDLDPAVTANATEVATSYLAAIASFNADTAASYLTEAALADVGGLERLRLDAAWDKASVFTILAGNCELRSESSTGATVRCPYDFQGIRSDEMGLGPFSGSYYQFIVEDGEISSVSGTIETDRNRFSVTVWEPFAEWVSTAYPDDAAIMYTDSSLSDYRLTDESIQLWEQHSHEYVDQGGWATPIAASYLEAIATFDADLEATFLTDAALADMGGLERLQLDAAWRRASGFMTLPGPCELRRASAVGATVRCPYDFQGIRSDEMGLGPFGGSYYDFVVEDSMITSVSGTIETGPNEFSATVWEPFAEWVSNAYPDDAAIMYIDSSLSDYRLTDESIQLWEQHSHEYVDDVFGGTAATTP
jgi:hypothetical protein